MTSQTPPAPLPDWLLCQTPDCPNPVAVVITRLEDGEADELCMVCTLAMWAAVLQEAHANGTLGDLSVPATGG